MRRRRLLATLWTSFIAGCTAESKSVSITLQNFSSRKAQIGLQLIQNGEEQYENTITINQESKLHLENVVSGGSYQINVSTDKFGKTKRMISMNGCNEQEVSVAILPSEKLDLQLREC